MEPRGTVAVRSLWRCERTDAGDVACCVFQLVCSCKLGVTAALARSVGSRRILRALVIMDRFSRDRSLPPLPPLRTSPGHQDSSSDSAVPYSCYCLVLEGLLTGCRSVVSLPCMSS